MPRMRTTALLAGFTSPKGACPVDDNRLVLIRVQAVSYPGKFKLRQKIANDVVQDCTMTGKRPMHRQGA